MPSLDDIPPDRMTPDPNEVTREELLALLKKIYVHHDEEKIQLSEELFDEVEALVEKAGDAEHREHCGRCVPRHVWSVRQAISAGATSLDEAAQLTGLSQMQLVSAWGFVRENP